MWFSGDKKFSLDLATLSSLESAMKKQNRWLNPLNQNYFKREVNNGRCDNAAPPCGRFSDFLC